jgi:hypothetical protein
MVFDGGVLENVVITNVTIDCQRFDWFWWGDGDPLHFNLIQRSEIDPNIDKTKEPPVGAMRNVILRNVIARGVGACLIHGHKESPLENIALENVRLEIGSDSLSPLQKSPEAVTLENARNIRLKDVEIVWRTPVSEAWKSALVVENVHGLTLDGLSARQAPNGTGAPAVALKQVAGAVVRNCQAQESTGTFLQIGGEGTRDIVVWGNAAQTPVKVTEGVREGALRLVR